jgi:hypothetical protein
MNLQNLDEIGNKSQDNGDNQEEFSGFFRANLARRLRERRDDPCHDVDHIAKYSDLGIYSQIEFTYSCKTCHQESRRLPSIPSGLKIGLDLIIPEIEGPLIGKPSNSTMVTHSI